MACSAMALQKSAEMKGQDAASSSSTWAKWKRGGIIGAAALTGGTLMAITGGTANSNLLTFFLEISAFCFGYLISFTWLY